MASDAFASEAVDALVGRAVLEPTRQSRPVPICLSAQEDLGVGLVLVARLSRCRRHGRVRRRGLHVARLDARGDGTVLLAARFTLGVEPCTGLGPAPILLLVSEFAERCADLAPTVLADPAARVSQLLQFVLRGQ